MFSKLFTYAAEFIIGFSFNTRRHEELRLRVLAGRHELPRGGREGGRLRGAEEGRPGCRALPAPARPASAGTAEE